MYIYTHAIALIVAGKRGTIRSAIVEYKRLGSKNTSNVAEAEGSSGVGAFSVTSACLCYFVSTGTLDTQLQGALERVLAKPKETVHVDMDVTLEACGLKAHFPMVTWPPSLAVTIIRFVLT